MAQVAPLQTPGGAPSAPAPNAVGGAAVATPGVTTNTDTPALKVKGQKGIDSTLLKTVVQPYVDDTDLYVPKITRKARYRYWEKMMAQKSRRVVPKDHFSYQDKVAAGNPENSKFPSLAMLLLKIVTNPIWDYLYLFIFMLWILLEIVVFDGLALKYLPPGLFGTPDNSTSAIPSIGGADPAALAGAAAIGLTPATMVLPLIFMFLVQLIPTLGIIYFVVRCNDLVKFKAAGKMGGWAFTSVLMAQIVEYAWYGGNGNVSKAGTSRIRDDRASSFMRFSSAKTHSKKIVVEVTPSDGYESDDSEAKHAFDSDSSDEEVATKIRKAFDEACREAEEKGEEPPVMPQEEMSAYAALRLKLAEEKAEKEAELAAKIKAAEASCRDWTEWTCLVCNLQNRRPTHPVREVDVRFGTKGTYYKRTYAIIRESRDAPQCTHCMTYSDYVPPMGSAHWFKYNKKPHVAFKDYPMVSQIQSGLSNKWHHRYYNATRSFFLGIKDNSASKLVYNDWRLPVYVNGVFPELPRQVKPASEIFQLGEMVECRLQKSDWCRARVIAARPNHTYDIRFDPGDELRLVLEENLRLPPEKRYFAYLIEFMMVVLVLSFPLGLAIGSLAIPAAVTLGPLLVALVLFTVRVYKTIRYMRIYHYAGICPIFRLALFFTLPLFLLLLASVLPFLNGSWTTTAIFFIAAKFTSCPVMYVQKPNFAVFSVYFFLQTSAGLYLLGAYMDGNPVYPMLAVALAPFFTAGATAMYMRRNLEAVWDVQMVIRPPFNFVPDRRTFKEKIEDFLGFSF